MARSQSLLSPEPSNVVHQPVSICHVQLRDLIICPDERGVVNYVQDQCIIEHDISDPSSAPTPLVSLNYIPNTIASLPIPDTDERLLAAGGQDAELHLSIHSRRNPSPRNSSHTAPPRPTRRLWQYDNVLSGSINNSVLLTSLSLTRSNESSAEPRVAVSNNDCTVKFFDVNVRGTKGVDGPPKRISEVGTLRLDVPVNHSSISPDGRTLLSVGDSPQVYLHGMTGGARITFTPLAQLTLPPFDSHPGAYSIHSASALPASFCTAFSPSGSKFAVASQEGMVAVWDVRSRKPMKVFTTDRGRLPPGSSGGMGRSGSRPMGTASGWLYEDTWDWTMPAHRAPGWGVRNVKFSSGIDGKELMTFTEHTSLLHVIDATTFEHEEIVRVPAIVADPPPSASPRPSVPTTPSSARSSPAPIPSPNHHHPPQPYVRTLGTGLQHVSAPHLHTHPHGHGHYHHHYHSAIPPPPAHTSSERDRRLRVRVRQRDVLLTTAPSPVPVPTSGPTTPLLARRRSHVEVGYNPGAGMEMDVDADTDEMDDMDDAEAETDCLTSRAPSRAASPPPPPPPPQQQHGRQPRRPAAPYTPGGGGTSAIQTPAHLDLAGTCFDPRGAWLYVASTSGIVEWRVRGGEKRWWSESVWA
ncbi:WD40-repeat-containing domain protein [Lactarius indigo]|nr:WD40-repeat-containing domain protein [Lactarius indigo]